MNGVEIVWTEEVYEFHKAELPNGWTALVLRRVGAQKYVGRASRAGETRDTDRAYDSLVAAQLAAIELAMGAGRG